MINGSELHIGNWVERTYRARDTRHKENVKIAAIEFNENEPNAEYYVGNEFSDCGDSLLFSLNSFSPIPLMAQHFISAGFEWHGTRLCYPKITIDAWGIHDFTFKLGEIHIEYVHQLQNIVRVLTGEELEIKL